MKTKEQIIVNELKELEATEEQKNRFIELCMKYWEIDSFEIINK